MVPLLIVLLYQASQVGMAYNPNNYNIYVTNFGSNGSPGNTVTRVSTTSNVPDVAVYPFDTKFDHGYF
jgi:DNA-binding beta-propeller fold protein YncE